MLDARVQAVSTAAHETFPGAAHVTRRHPAIAKPRAIAGPALSSRRLPAIDELRAVHRRAPCRNERSPAIVAERRQGANR